MEKLASLQISSSLTFCFSKGFIQLHGSWMHPYAFTYIYIYTVCAAKNIVDNFTLTQMLWKLLQIVAFTCGFKFTTDNSMDFWPLSYQIYAHLWLRSNTSSNSGRKLADILDIPLSPCCFGLTMPQCDRGSKLILASQPSWRQVIVTVDGGNSAQIKGGRRRRGDCSK